MHHRYLIPTLYIIPHGYTAELALPWNKIAKLLVAQTCELQLEWTKTNNGQVVESDVIEVQFKDGVVGQGTPWALNWESSFRSTPHEPDFVEVSISSIDSEFVFGTNLPVGSYLALSRADSRMVLSDGALRFASPPVIKQIEEFGRYVDAYPVCRLDRESNHCDSIGFVNPYAKEILATVMRRDGHAIRGVRVAPASARIVNLDGLLKPDEERYLGPVQVTAKNRIITFTMKHPWGRLDQLSHCEHMDPFRGEPTHIPLALHMRRMLGAMA